MNITIVGGGNVGTQFAVHCAEKKHNVIIFSSKPDKFKGHLEIVDENGVVIKFADGIQATDIDRIAFENADMVFVTVPAFAMEDMSVKILPYVKKGIKIGLIPGTGGGECAFKKCIDSGAIVFGMQRVPSVARLVEYGEKVCATGYRKELHVAAIPRQFTKECCTDIENIFDMKCIPLPNYLNLTLTPSNPILHTTRLKTIFKDYHDGVFYDRLPLFCENWDNESSELLLKCDDEVQKICEKLDQFDLSFVKSLKKHYESENEEQLTKKISSIPGFKGLTTPSIEINGKFIPNLSSRYFTADFPFGLLILLQIAEIVGVDVPNMKETMLWYNNISNSKKGFSFKKYNIVNLEEFCDFYNK